MHQSGLSTRELARRVGSHHSFIDHLLSGRKDTCAADRADKIASAIKAPTDVLFENEFGPYEGDRDDS
ncbi:hypothetical protein NWFMUON74_61000 [Nocardia wallacei]|uniref:HTH cro/C1-type domain-containing protein n=2 Tax=Nocardia wallacei TaxID=480035 RepID=A0A7G1KSV0_9NOCA|nr:hypothetical protein NWFMUON74_61000 [Nocardia wallacei]